MTPEEIAAQEAAKAAEMTNLMEEIKGIGETLQGLGTQVEELKAASAPVEPPVNPALDPRNAPPEDWGKLRDEIENTAVAKAEEKLQARDKAETEKKEKAVEAEKDWDNKFEEEATKAVEAGFLPAITDPQDHNDPGNAARRDLFGFAAHLEQTDLSKVAETVKMYNDQGKHFDLDQGKWIQSTYRAMGKNVPVGSSANRVSNPNAGMSYEELHQSSLDTLTRKAKQKYGII